MAVEVIISHPSLPGLHEVKTFIGAANQTAIVPGEEDEYLGQIDYLQPVGGSAETRFWQLRLADGRVRKLVRGALFVRPLRQTGDDAEPRGGWTYWRTGWGAATDAIRLTVRAYAPTAAAEAPMNTPLGGGTPLFRGGVRVFRPASGQQDVDPWTGEPLLDAQGQPVLVP